MKLIPIDGEATHVLQINRADAFEIAQMLVAGLADPAQEMLGIYIFNDEAEQSPGPTVLCQMPDAIGGDVAVSDVPENYQGVCLVAQNSGSDRMIAIMPSKEEAYRVARYAVSVDGGYGSVRVSAAPGVTPTHTSFNDWAF